MQYSGLRRDEVSALLRRSQRFRAAADYHMANADYDLAVFNIEQALQLFLKAKLLENGADFPKTHTIRKLFVLLGEIYGRREIFESFVRDRIIEFSALEDAYITSRYFPRDFSREEALRLIKFCDEVVKFVGQVRD